MKPRRRAISRPCRARAIDSSARSIRRRRRKRQPPAKRRYPRNVAAPTSPIRRSRRTYLYVGAAVALLLVAGLTFVALRRESTPATQTPAVAAAPASSLDSRTIAVLPFRAATPGETNEALALVVTDVVRNRLATFKGVVVIASGSMAHLADAHLDARETGRKLNARFLLRGSAAHAGDQITYRGRARRCGVRRAAVVDLVRPFRDGCRGPS